MAVVRSILFIIIMTPLFNQAHAEEDAVHIEQVAIESTSKMAQSISNLIINSKNSKNPMVIKDEAISLFTQIFIMISSFIKHRRQKKQNRSIQIIDISSDIESQIEQLAKQFVDQLIEKKEECKS